MDTEENPQQERDLLAKTLKRFKLSYEQHQMLHGNGIGLLASQIAAKRKLFTIILGVAAALFALQAARGLLANGSYIGWIVISAIAALWCFKRHVKTRMLQRALAEFAQHDSEQPLEHGLADELRLKFKLQYDEHQALHSGEPELAAERIVKRCHENTRTSIVGAASLSGLGLLWVASSLYDETPVIEGFGAWVSITTIAIVCVIAIAVNDKSKIRQVDRLLAKYKSDVQDAQ